MRTPNVARPPDQWWMIGRRVAVPVLVVAALVAAYGTLGMRGTSLSAQKAAALQGMGSVTGTVTASKPFKAAQIYLKSTDKRRRMQYMVYTNQGNFRAVALFPGNYEVVAKARGLESDPQTVAIKTGDNPALKFTMHNAKDPNQYPSSVDSSTVTVSNGTSWTPSIPVTLASYEEIYPPGPGRVVLETLCMNCHGENSFPLKPRSASG